MFKYRIPQPSTNRSRFDRLIFILLSENYIQYYCAVLDPWDGKINHTNLLGYLLINFLLGYSLSIIFKER